LRLTEELADLTREVTKLRDAEVRAVQHGIRSGGLRSEVGEDTGYGLEHLERAPDPWTEPVRTGDTTELRSRALTAVERTSRLGVLLPHRSGHDHE
jgi:hypothetical protein